MLLADIKLNWSKHIRHAMWWSVKALEQEHSISESQIMNTELKQCYTVIFLFRLSVVAYEL